MTTTKVLLIDGSSFLHRAYHSPALRKLTTPDGQPSGTIFGFNRSLDLFLKYYQPTHCCVVFDPRGKTARHQWFTQYKANRPPTPPEIVNAYAQITQLVQSRNIACYQHPGEEADDVIGTLAKQASNLGMNVIIATGDKDLAQLVTNNIILTNSKIQGIEEMDEQRLIEKYNLSASQISDYLALMGDSVDNIPGVAGVGNKKAQQLLQEYQSIEGILENRDIIKGKIGEAIRNSVEDLKLYQKLTIINCDIELQITIDEIEVKPEQITHLQELKKLYQQLGFSKELKLIEERLSNHQTLETPLSLSSVSHETKDQESQSDQSKQSKINAILSNPEEILNQLSKLVKENSNDNNKAHFVSTQTFTGFYIAGINQLWYAPTNEFYIESFNWHQLSQLPIDIYSYDWKVLAHRFDLPKITNNLKDLLLISYVLNAGTFGHSWKGLITHYRLIGDNLPLMELMKIDQSQTKKTLTEIQSLELLLQHCDWSNQLQKILSSELEDSQNSSDMQEVLQTIEIPLINILYQMEKIGVQIDLQKLTQIDNQLSEKTSLVVDKINQFSEQSINLDSPKQVAELLFETLQLPVIKKTKTGSPSTDEETLKELSNQGVEIATLLTQYRGLAKLQSTYSRGLVKHLDSKNRIHTTLNQMVASTGRLSSSEPNLQNIPIRDETGKLIRSAFIASDGGQIVSADYSQIELRILAHVSQDKELIKAFNNKLDIHALTATKLFNQSLEDITDNQRRYAKTINFGLIYGMSSFSLAKHLNIKVNQAKQWIDSYFHQFPSIKSYMQQTKQRAKETGYVETMFGRRIHLPDINAKNHTLRSYAERAAINAPIQGAAADIIKKAMITVHQWSENREDIKMVLQIHDELLFEVVPTHDIECRNEILTDVLTIMQQVVNLSVPLEVDIGIGKSWSEAH